MIGTMERRRHIRPEEDEIKRIPTMLHKTTAMALYFFFAVFIAKNGNDRHNIVLAVELLSAHPNENDFHSSGAACLLRTIAKMTCRVIITSKHAIE